MKHGTEHQGIPSLHCCSDLFLRALLAFYTQAIRLWSMLEEDLWTSTWECSSQQQSLQDFKEPCACLSSCSPPYNSQATAQELSVAEPWGSITSLGKPSQTSSPLPSVKEQVQKDKLQVIEYTQ